jgi:hypothetical protein
MAINSIPPGSYNSPSVQPQAQIQVQQTPEKKTESKREEPHRAPPERSSPTVNTSGHTVGTRINTTA